jgi:hypothetical protein
MAVRYLVVPNHNGPAGSGAVPVATPGALLAGLLLQTDLEIVNVDANYTVYQNAAWAPLRSVLSPAVATGVAARSGDLRALERTDLTGSAPVLNRGRPTRTSGSVPPGSTVYVAQSRQSDWRLHVAGRTVSPQPAFGWGMSFPVPSSSPAATNTAAPASLELPPNSGLRDAQMLGILLWLVAISLVVIDVRRRRIEHPPRETVRPEWFVTPRSAGAAPGRRRHLQGGLGAEDLEGEELWIDV